MIELGRRGYLLFDGDCGICSYCADWARNRDRRLQFVVEPYQLFSEKELVKVGLTYHDCSREVQVITRRGRVLGGAIGINYFLLRRFPWAIVVILIYAVPVLLVLEIVFYRLIARNRHRISRWLGLKACLLKD